MDDPLVSITEKGELSITKSNAKETPKEYFIIAYPKGEKSSGFPKKPIKIQLAPCVNEKLEAKNNNAIKKDFRDNKIANLKATEDIEFATVESWF